MPGFVMEKRELEAHREIVSILMESSLYFDLPLKERLVLIQRLAVRMDDDQESNVQK